MIFYIFSSSFRLLSALLRKFSLQLNFITNAKHLMKNRTSALAGGTGDKANEEEELERIFIFFVKMNK